MSALPCPVANPFAEADQTYAAITGFLSSKEAYRVNHSELERELEGMGRDLLRKLLQAHLDLRQPGQAVEAVRDAKGTPLEPTAVHERSVESIFGTVEVTRTGYRAEGTAPGSASVHPLDGALNLPPEKYSLEVRRRAAIEAAKGSFDEGVKTLEMYTGAHVPKRQFEQLVKRAARDFEAFYAQRQSDAGADGETQTGSILVLTVDGKGVVMLPEDLREATQRAALSVPRPLRRGWAVAAGCMPNGWPRWLPFTPSSRSCVRPNRSCQKPAGRKRGSSGHGRNTNGSGPAWRSRLRT